MGDRNRSRQYTSNDPSGCYSWSPYESPSEGLEQLLGPIEAQLHADHQYQASNLHEGCVYAPSSSTTSDWGSDIAQYRYIEGQPNYQPNYSPPLARFGGQSAQPYYPEACPSVQDYADNVAPTQWPGQYEDAEVDVEDEVIHFPRQRRQRKPKARTAALLPKGQPKSKRAMKRAQILHEHGSVSATDKPRGRTRMRFGVLEWFNPRRQTFYAAASLDDYRHQIVSEDMARGAYDFTPDHGLHEDDVTTYPLDDSLGQQHWNLVDRSTWVNIKDHDGNQVMYCLEKPDRDVEPPYPGFMMYNNLIMLDQDDHPVIDWPGIPRCFSSQLEGARMEALRRIYPWLSVPQFRARMPRYVIRKAGGVQPLFGLSSLQQRLTRFREVYDCPPWKKVHVSRGADMVKHTKERLAKEGLSGDSTAGLSPLKRREILRRKKESSGRCPENAGIYTLTEEEKQEKAAKEAARHQEVRAKKENALQEVAVLGSSGTKRKRDDATEPGSSLERVRKQSRCASSATIDTSQGSQGASLIPAYSMAQIGPIDSLPNAEIGSYSYFLEDGVWEGGLQFSTQTSPNPFHPDNDDAAKFETAAHEIRSNNVSTSSDHQQRSSDIMKIASVM